MSENKIIYSKESGMKPGDIEMTLTPDMEKVFKKYLEIEMITGERNVINGMVHYKINTSVEKSKLLQQALTKIILNIQDNEN